MRTLEKDGIEAKSNQSTTERIINNKTLRLLANMGAALALVMASGACKKEAEKKPIISEDQLLREELAKMELEELHNMFFEAYYERPKPNSHVVMQTALVIQEKSKNLSESALGKYKNIPEIAPLYEHLTENATYSVAGFFTMMGEKDKKKIPTADEFVISYMPSRMPIPRVVVVGNDGRSIKIDANLKQPQWIALALAHGVSLSYDYLKAETETTPLEKDLNAYLREIEVLKASNPQVYEQIMNEGVPLFGDIIQQGGSFNDIAGYCQQIYGLHQPHITNAERKIGTSVCALAILYATTLGKDPTKGDLVPVEKKQLIDAMTRIMNNPT